MTIRTKVLLAVGAVIVLLCGVGGWFISSNVRGTTVALQEDARLTGDEILETLGKTWSIERLRDAASADFLAAVPDEDQKLDWLKKMRETLGAYKSGKGLVAEVKAVKGVEGKDVLGITYTNEATFEKKKAKVRLQLVMRESGGWQMATFDADPL
jgi:hypothetical protein